PLGQFESRAQPAVLLRAVIRERPKLFALLLTLSLTAIVTALPNHIWENGRFPKCDWGALSRSLSERVSKEAQRAWAARGLRRGAKPLVERGIQTDPG